METPNASSRHWFAEIKSLLDALPMPAMYGCVNPEQEATDDMQLLYVNTLCTKAAGLLADSGPSFRRLIPDGQEADAAYMADFLRVALTGEPYTFERYHQRLGKWFSATLYSPHPRHVVAMLEDITLRKQAEARWREVIAVSRVPIALNDNFGNVTYINPAFVETFGYQLQEISTLEDWWVRAYPDVNYRAWVIEVWGARLEASFKTGTPFEEFEARIRCRNGEFKTVIASAARLSSGEEHMISLVDVTELIQAKASVQDAEQYAELILDSVGEGLCQINREGVVTFINPVGAQLLGYQAHEVIGQQAHPLFHHSHADGRRYPASECKIMEAVRQRYTTSSDQDVFWRRDGSHFPVHFVSAPMVVKGENRGAVITFRDITQEVESREARAKDQVKIRKAQEMAGFGSYDTDLRTGLWQSSDQLDSIFGITAAYPHDIPHWNEILAPEFRQPAMDHYEEVARGEKEFRMDYRIIRPVDGVSRWVAANGELIRDEAGVPVRLIGTIQDITERKESEAALVRSHELLMKLAEQIPGALYQFKLAADGGFSIPFSSRGLSSIFGIDTRGFDRDAAPIFGAIVEADREAVLQSIRESAEKLETWKEEFRVMRGEQVAWVQGQARPERLPDGGVLWHGFTHDVTDRVNTQLELRQLNENLEERVEQRTLELAQALESAEFAKRSRGEFLAKMSHEIRTPLNAILGMAFLALKGESSPERRQQLQRIRDSGKHLLGIINDILDFSKIDAGKLQLDIAEFDLKTFVQRILSLVEARAGEKGLYLKVRMDEEVPTKLIGDSLRLGQVLVNLVNNAIKFTEKGGVAIDIHCLSSVSNEAERFPVKLCFEVQDSGIGMSKEQMTRLFQPFEQGDNSTTRKYGGSGLGLVISKQLAEMMGGEIGVSSAQGHGSAFWFSAWLEAVTGLDEAPSAFGDIQVEQDALDGRSILVVDDNDFNLDVAKGLLELTGASVGLAMNGREALEALESAHYDLILMDIQMPVMDGLEATRHIRADSRWNTLPILAMTANVREEDRLSYLNAGLNDVVIKPIDPDTFYQSLRRWLNGPVGPQPLSVPRSLIVADAPVEPDPELPLWDLSALKHSVGDNEQVHRRLLEKYLAGARIQVADIVKAVRNDDPELAGSVAHKLKSSSRTVGALQLGMLCEAIEKSGRACDTVSCLKLLGEMVSVFDAVSARIEAWLLGSAAQ